MNILFITRRSRPHVGGVETHIEEVRKRIVKKGNNIKIISGNDIKYPRIKMLGLFYIWAWFFRNRQQIKWADVVHVHDVFIWYLPFRFIYPYKKIFTTLHGWEGVYPIRLMSRFQKWLAVKLSNGSIGIGRFLEKYIGAKFTKILYGGVSKVRTIAAKNKNSIIFVGRLEPDTGLTEFLKYLKTHKYKSIDFIGDGSLRKECEKIGKVHGFTDPTPFYKKAETVIPSGYLTFLEAKSHGCKIKTFYSTPLKKEYWEEILKLKKFMTWDDVANEYLKLYNLKQ